VRVLVTGGMTAALLVALSSCSGAEVIEAHQIEQNEFIQGTPFPALKLEIEKLIDPPPATTFGLADNMPQAPPGGSIESGFTVLTIGKARVVGTRWLNI